ncbi:MAG: hypothetical protein WC205_03515 [Opitutaceae bacterium]|jgi:hypothetical protein
MTKVYFTVPLVALALFLGAFLWSQNARTTREREKARVHQAEQVAKADAEREARRLALDEGMRVQARLKEERLAREARETADRETRQAALDTRDQAFRDQERLARQIERLKREIANEQEAVNRLQLDADSDHAELVFLKTYIPQARDNAANLKTVLEKIAEADAARARQSAEDAKKKS